MWSTERWPIFRTRLKAAATRVDTPFTVTVTEQYPCSLTEGSETTPLRFLYLPLFEIWANLGVGGVGVEVPPPSVLGRFLDPPECEAVVLTPECPEWEAVAGAAAATAATAAPAAAVTATTAAVATAEAEVLLEAAAEEAAPLQHADAMQTSSKRTNRRQKRGGEVVVFIHEGDSRGRASVERAQTPLFAYSHDIMILCWVRN